ncbi:MAG: choice-of-anchor D domain-containing protein [Myxococcaceae bacterium]
MKNLLFVITGAIALVSGCKCGPTISGTKPDIVATPTALSFSACPTKDESGNTVKDVFPDFKKLNISNQGKVSTPLKFTLSGMGAASFALGGDGGVPADIGSLGMVELPISFSPSAKGDVKADLTIDDQTDDTNNPVVTLIGTGVNLPSNPLIETAPQKKDKSGFLLCTAETPLSDCTLEFPDTLMDQSTTLQLKIRNKGCPSLKITALEIDGSSNPGTNDGFTIDSPSVLPSTGTPFVLSTADGTDETTLTLRFTAVDDGSGTPNQSHYAVLTIKSNDPVNGDGFANPARLTIQANAVKPSIYVAPTSCNFTNAQDNCGFTTRTPHKANFRVTNDGATDIQISAVRFRSSGGTTSSNNRFSITQNIQGQTLTTGASATVEVTEVDMPLLVSDQLEIVSDIVGMPAGSGGSVMVSVISGIKPCLTTDPMDVVDFGDPADELSAKLVTIKNGASCGSLVINSIDVSMQPFYSLIDPVITPGTTIAPGQQMQATVQYHRPSTGGQQLAELTINTNDTDFGAPQYKKLLLQSNASLDSFPIAGLTACQPAQLVNDPNCAMGATNSATFNLSMINPDQITLSGVTSTDNNMVREYAFSLRPPVPGGSTTVLSNNGMRTTSNKQVLTIPPGGNGVYYIRLDVWDDRGQQSPSSATMTLSIFP